MFLSVWCPDSLLITAPSLISLRMAWTVTRSSEFSLCIDDGGGGGDDDADVVTNALYFRHVVQERLGTFLFFFLDGSRAALPSKSLVRIINMSLCMRKYEAPICPSVRRCMKGDQQPSTLSNCHCDFSSDYQLLRSARCPMSFVVDLFSRATTDCPRSTQKLWSERLISRSASRRVARAVGTTVARSVYDTA